MSDLRSSSNILLYYLFCLMKMKQSLPMDAKDSPQLSCPPRDLVPTGAKIATQISTLLTSQHFRVSEGAPATPKDLPPTNLVRSISYQKDYECTRPLMLYARGSCP
jgi:hypothetical protein